MLVGRLQSFSIRSTVHIAAMQEHQNIQTEVEYVLSRLSELVSARDLAALAEFSEDVVLVGSEAGEIASGLDQLRALLQSAFTQESRIAWTWHSVRASRCADMAWFFAEGELVLTSDTIEKRKPYRLSGVLGWQAERWKWRQFHGSEPAPP